MKAIGTALGLCGILAALTHATDANACGSEVAHYYDVDTYTQGTDVPLNAPIIVSLKPVGDAPDSMLFEPTLTLTKLGATETITAKSVGVRTALAFVVPQLLEPHTTYELSLNNLPAADDTTLPSRTWQLTTGAAIAPALSVAGKLEVTLEPGMDPVMDCSNSNDCGGNCVQTGTTAVTKARVKLPKFAGGFAKRLGLLNITDNTPHVFGTVFDATPHEVNTGQIIDLEAASPTEVLVTLPLEAKPYKPCFAYAIDDARTDEVVADSLCLDLFPAADPQPNLPSLGNDTGSGGNAGSPSKPASNDTPTRNDSHTSAGCAVQGSVNGRGAHGILLALGALLLTRRRRSKSAL